MSTHEPTQQFPYLIGLGGLKESGKDVVADTLVENALPDRPVVKIGMSDILNEILIVLDPWVYVPEAVAAPGMSRFEHYAAVIVTVGYNEAKRIPDVRRLLQALGNDVGRDMLSPSIWVNVAAKKIHAHMAQGRSVIVTGIRNPNEIDLIRMNGGTNVWVERPSLRSRKKDAHASENSVTMADFDAVISNARSLSALYREARQMEAAVIRHNEDARKRSGYTGLVMPTSPEPVMATPNPWDTLTPTLSPTLHTDAQMANIVGRTPTTAKPVGKRHCTCSHLDPWIISPTCERHKHLLAKTVPESGHDEG